MKGAKESEVTPEELFLSRRRFITGVGALAVGTLLSGCGTKGSTSDEVRSPSAVARSATAQNTDVGSRPSADEARSASQAISGAGRPSEATTSYDDVTGYNNYYEFSLEKDDVAQLARVLKISPWTVQVGGLVRNKKTYAIEDLLKRFTQEERIYRLRCVEAWSMVIPWTGFSLAKLLADVEPLSSARYVRFETLLDPQQMPGQRVDMFEWPYVEGLRLDEAMHELTLLATGLYGKPTLPQNGAPIRLVVPWKYGFKSIKSIVKIDLVEQVPISFWMAAAPDEYGFYANVNPDVHHPRWSQSSEHRIGEGGRRRTLPFNGYAEQVAHLYSGMDLRRFF